MGESREGEGRAAGPTTDVSIMGILATWARDTGRSYHILEDGTPDGEVTLVIGPPATDQPQTREDAADGAA